MEPANEPPENSSGRCSGCISSLATCLCFKLGDGLEKFEKRKKKYNKTNYKNMHINLRFKQYIAR